MREYHGGCGSALYNVWKTMRQRCFNPNDRKFERYGGRGIELCPEWNSFSNFRDWAQANGYRAGLSIERNDNDGPYAPDNCRWASPSKQARNRSDTLRLSDGRSGADVAEQNGIKYQTFRNRIYKQGWSVDDACTRAISR